MGSVRRDAKLLYNEGFKRARNKIRKQNSDALVWECLKRLPRSRPDKANLETYRNYPPWMLLLLAKWALIHGANSDRTQRVPDPVFNDLINELKEIDGNLPLPSDFDHHYLFLRKTAYQQFWFVNIIPPGSMVARQYALFRQLPTTHRFRRWLITICGLEIEEFLDLAFVLMTRFIHHEDANWIDVTWFDPVSHYYSREKIQQFLSLLGKPLGTIRSDIIEQEPTGRRDPSEFHAPTPFLRYPLVLSGERYYCPHRAVLFQSLNNFLFDRFREYDPDAFMGTFGPIFQKHIQTGLNESNCDWIGENALKAHLPADSSVTDFLVNDPGARILIEAKGIELGTRAMTGTAYDTVFDRSKTTALKGVVQGLTCATALAGNSNDFSLESRNTNYLLIVTYKPTFLGSGQDLLREGFRERLNKRINGDIEQQAIPLSNVYFISVHDWDLLVSAVTQSDHTMSEILDRARERDSNPKTKRFVLEQHISEQFPDLELPSHLRRALDDGLSGVEAALTGGR